MLSNCNSLSATRLERARRDFRGHSQLLLDLKKDLDAIFRRIRTLKTKVAQQNPEAFQGSFILSGWGLGPSAKTSAPKSPLPLYQE